MCDSSYTFMYGCYSPTREDGPVEEPLPPSAVSPAPRHIAKAICKGGCPAVACSLDEPVWIQRARPSAAIVGAQTQGKSQGAISAHCNAAVAARSFH